MSDPAVEGRARTGAKRTVADDRAAARAALSLLESLIIALLEAGVVTRAEIEGLLQDARASHDGQPGDHDGVGAHDPTDAIDVKAGRLIQRIVEGSLRAEQGPSPGAPP